MGDVEFSVVESENPQDSVTITDKPVELGQDVSEHVKRNPSIMTITGQMIGADASDKLQMLKKYQNNGTLLKYIGRNIYSNMAIVDIDRVHPVENRIGFSFTIKLKHLRIATANRVQIKIKIKNPKTKKPNKKKVTKVKPKANKGKQQPKKKKIKTTKSTTKKSMPKTYPNSPKLVKKTDFVPKTPLDNMNRLISSFKPYGLK